MANRSLAQIVRQTNDLLVGCDPFRIEELWHKTFRAFTYMGSRGAGTAAISAIDIALWDIRGKSLGVPVYELLGGRVRESLPIYTHPNQSRFTDEDGAIDASGVKDEIRRILDSGHNAIKFDPYPRSPREPASEHFLSGQLSRAAELFANELTALIREITGPGIELLIDAHGRFDVPTAIRLCNSLDDVAQIHWFEEPVPPESLDALRQVRQGVGAAIAVGERAHTRWDFATILHQGLADYIMPDVTWTGGISELKKISTLAETYYLPMTPHDASGPINIIAGAHVMMTVPNFYRIETRSFDLSSYNQLLRAPLDNTGGQLTLSGEPGLGIEIDRDYIRANAVEGYGGHPS
jgi:galactonate dehydratase